MFAQVSDVVIVAVMAGVVGPLTVGFVSARQTRLTKEQDWERQDLVAKRAEERQERMAFQASESARAIVNVNQHAVDIAAHNSGQLQVIHTLVNSQMTAAVRSEHDAIVNTLAMMREMVRIQQTAGNEPTQQTLAAIEATELKVADLEKRLLEREKDDELARAQLANAAVEVSDDARTAEIRDRPHPSPSI